MRCANKKAKNDAFEKELWGCLSELYNQFAIINEIKKKNLEKNLYKIVL